MDYKNNKNNKNKTDKNWHPFLVRLYQGCSLEIRVEKSGKKKENFANMYL